jgi:hypothetical protein
MTPPPLFLAREEPPKRGAAAVPVQTPLSFEHARSAFAAAAQLGGDSTFESAVNEFARLHLKAVGPVAEAPAPAFPLVIDGMTFHELINSRPRCRPEDIGQDDEGRVADTRFAKRSQRRR